MFSHTHIQNAHGHNIVISGGIYPGGSRVRLNDWEWNEAFQYHDTTIQQTTATNQNAGSSQAHTHPLDLKELNMYGWIRTT